MKILFFSNCILFLQLFNLVDIYVCYCPIYIGHGRTNQRGFCISYQALIWPTKHGFFRIKEREILFMVFVSRIILIGLINHWYILQNSIKTININFGKIIQSKESIYSEGTLNFQMIKMGSNKV